MPNYVRNFLFVFGDDTEIIDAFFREYDAVDCTFWGTKDGTRWKGIDYHRTSLETNWSPPLRYLVKWGKMFPALRFWNLSKVDTAACGCVITVQDDIFTVDDRSSEPSNETETVHGIASLDENDPHTFLRRLEFDAFVDEPRENEVRV
jgi:hypothetical protein